MHPGVEGLALDEQGFVLGAALAHLTAGEVAAQLEGAAGERCAIALAALAAELKTARVATIAELIALLRAPVPAGVERLHAGWLHERLVPETTAVIRAVTASLPDAVRAVADEILRARDRDEPALTTDADGVAELQRAVFGGLVPLAGPGGPRGRARELAALEPAALDETIARHGAEVVGTSLRGAPPTVLARAAAALGERLAPSLLDAAARGGTPGERDQARGAVARIVETTGGETGRDACFALGLPLLAARLRDDGTAAVLAVAQRLSPEIGRRLLAAAGIEA